MKDTMWPSKGKGQGKISGTDREALFNPRDARAAVSEILGGKLWGSLQVRPEGVEPWPDRAQRALAAAWGCT